MLTRQEIFDNAFLGLQRQNFERALEGGMCQYRAGKLKCAIGHVLPDNKYNPNFDLGGGGFTQVMIACEIKEVDWDFARDMQHCHDAARDASEMLDRLLQFAAQNHLNAPMDLGSRWYNLAFKSINGRTPEPWEMPASVHKGYPTDYAMAQYIKNPGSLDT